MNIHNTKNRIQPSNSNIVTSKKKETGSYEPLSDEHAAYLRSLVKQAGDKDPNYEIFGSQSHKYRLNPVITLKQVKEFEQTYHLKLPEEYVFFLTKVGNGGAGPYYGLYSLEQISCYTEYIDSYTENDFFDLPLIDQNLTPEKWAELMDEEEVDLDTETSDALWEATMKQLCSGALVIGTQGCTYDHLLMWKGSEEGKVVYIDWNLDPEYMPYLTGFSFLQWYESFFLEIIAGHNLSSYGYCRLQSEQELIEAYHKTKDRKEKREIITGFYKFNEASSDTISFLETIEDAEFDAMRTMLLFCFDLEAGIRVFNSLIAGKNPQEAITCARRMPQEYKDSYYSRMLKLLYEPDIQNKDHLLYFLSDCVSCRTKDFIPFAMNENNKEDERKTAIYVMGLCQDKMDYLKEFITIMRGPSYWLAHTALQAVSRSKSSFLIETYEWMWEKYKEDSIMRSNLKIAFETNGIIRN